MKRMRRRPAIRSAKNAPVKCGPFTQHRSSIERRCGQAASKINAPDLLGEKLAPEVSRNGSAPIVVEHAHRDAVRQAGPVYAALEAAPWRISLAG